MRSIVIAIFILAGLNACSGDKKTEVAESAAAPVSVETVQLTDEQLKQAQLSIGAVEKQRLSAELKLNGVVDVPPQNMISVSFPMGGYLKSTKLIPGMHVSKGELIAVMEDQALIQLQQDFLMAKTKSEYLKQELDRQTLLNENKVNAEKVYQQVVSDYNTNQLK